MDKTADLTSGPHCNSTKQEMKPKRWNIHTFFASFPPSHAWTSPKDTPISFKELSNFAAVRVRPRPSGDGDHDDGGGGGEGEGMMRRTRRGNGTADERVLCRECFPSPLLITIGLPELLYPSGEGGICICHLQKFWSFDTITNKPISFISYAFWESPSSTNADITCACP